MSPAARLFAAVDLPEPIRADLAAWARAATGGRAELRPVPAENLHLTLCFLGGRDEGDVEPIAGLVAGCARGPVRLALGKALWLAPRRPHVLTVAVLDPDGRLAELQRAVAGALAAGAGHAPEARPFRPHVTVARVRRGARIDLRDADLPPLPERSFAAAALTLYRSRLGPGGSRYEAVGSTRLTSRR